MSDGEEDLSENEWLNTLATLPDHAREFIADSVSWYDASHPAKYDNKIHCTPLSLVDPRSREAKQDLGQLSTLSLELLWKILRVSNLAAVVQFANVNYHARPVVTELLEMRNIVNFAAAPLGKLMRVGAAGYITLQRFHELFIERTCFKCGRFAARVSLLLWERCCSLCVKTLPELNPTSMRIAMKCFGIPRSIVERDVPMILARRNSCLINRTFYPCRSRPRKILSLRAVKEVALALHGCPIKLHQRVAT